MDSTGQKRVIGLLGVGFDNEDGHIRITDAGDCKVMMGSGETHRKLQEICIRVNQSIEASGRPISDYSPDELMEILQKVC